MKFRLRRLAAEHRVEEEILNHVENRLPLTAVVDKVPLACGEVRFFRTAHPRCGRAPKLARVQAKFLNVKP